MWRGALLGTPSTLSSQDLSLEADVLSDEGSNFVQTCFRIHLLVVFYTFGTGNCLQPSLCHAGVHTMLPHEYKLIPPC